MEEKQDVKIKNQEVKIIFIFENKENDTNYPTIICKRDAKINDIFGQFCKITGKNIDNIIFYYKGEKIDIKLKQNLKLEEMFKEDSVIKLLCFEPKYLQQRKKNPIEHLENYIIDFIDYKVYIKEVKNEILLEKLLLDEKSYFGKINEIKIKCDEESCKNELRNYNESFYRCVNCPKNLCKICNEKHQKSHNVIKYDLKDYICNENLLPLPFVSYCKTCKKDLCEQCKFEHNKLHQFIDLTQILKNKDSRQKNFNKLNEKIMNFKLEINKIITKLRKVISNFESYYDIVSSIINKNKNRENLFNYELYKNMENIDKYNKIIIKDINEIEKEELDGNKIEKILQIYNKMINKNEITMEYKIKYEDDKIKIFGDEFFENNKDNFHIILDDMEYKLINILNKSDVGKSNKTFTITLKEVEKVTNLNYIFNDCSNLISVKGFSNWNMNDITEMKAVFSGCSSLDELSDISKWSMKNVTDISSMFNGCASLISMPDISNWDTKNMTNMKELFCGCKSLKSLPDISKWDISKVTDISSMFSECSSLTSLPDISKWKTEEVTDIQELFSMCSSLKNIPNISNWVTDKITDMSGLFRKCFSLKELPDISKWNTSKVTTMQSMFIRCDSLIKLPNISGWDTGRVEDMSSMFNGCKNLESIPDISKWNTFNVKNMKSMFSSCISLKSIPDFSNWKTDNVDNIDYMFLECHSLKSLPNIKFLDSVNKSKIASSENDCTII